MATVKSRPDGPAPLRHRRLASTTASRPSSAGCCSTPSRSSTTSSRPSRPPASRRATTTPTSRCSPTACAPSASRASPSTWPTATSRRPSRKFIIADTPGHVQYTRNMVTGASTADLGLVLVDARQGLTEQSRRHAVILSLLRVPHLVLAVNKMDLVDYSQEVYEQDPRRVHPVRDQAQHPRPRGHPDLGAPGRQRRQPLREHELVLRPDADAPPRARPRRLRPRPGRRPLPGAVRRAPQVRRAPRLPRLRRHGRRRRPQARRRGRRAAQRHDLQDRRHRPLRPRDRRGVPADVGHRPARGRRRRLPRRHDRPGQQRPAAQPGHRRDGLLDDHRSRCGRARSWPSSTPPAPRGPWSRTSSTASTSTRCTATRRPRSSASTRSAAIQLRTTAAAAVRPLLARTAPPGRSSSSTRPPASPSAPG